MEKNHHKYNQKYMIKFNYDYIKCNKKIIDNEKISLKTLQSKFHCNL